MGYRQRRGETADREPPADRDGFSAPMEAAIEAAATELAADHDVEREGLLAATSALSEGEVGPAAAIAALEPIASLSSTTGEPPPVCAAYVLRVNAVWGASAAETAARTLGAIDDGLTFADCRAVLRYVPACDGADPRRRVGRVLEDARAGKRYGYSGDRLARYVHDG